MGDPQLKIRSLCVTIGHSLSCMKNIVVWNGS